MYCRARDRQLVAYLGISRAHPIHQGPVSVKHQNYQKIDLDSPCLIVMPRLEVSSLDILSFGDSYVSLDFLPVRLITILSMWD